MFQNQQPRGCSLASLLVQLALAHRGGDLESLTGQTAESGDRGSLLTLQRFPVYHPLDGGLGVPIGSTHQSPVLSRSQDKVLGFVQPVGSSWKTSTVQAGGLDGTGQAEDTRPSPSRRAGAPECQLQAVTTCPGLILMG